MRAGIVLICAILAGEAGPDAAIAKRDFGRGHDFVAGGVPWRAGQSRLSIEYGKGRSSP
jgi:hypothetical protein